MKPQAAGARGQVSPPPAENKMSMWVWAPGHLRPALERTGLCRPGRAPGTIPSCIICKYCEVKPPPPLRPLGGEGIAWPHPAKVSSLLCFCPLLRHRYCKLAGLNCGQGRPALSGPGGQGLGPAHPEKSQCWGKGREKRRAHPEPLLERN